MPRPVVTATTEEAYRGLGPLTEPDADLDYPLLRFVASVADQLQVVNDLARDTDEAPGWAKVFDPARTPDEFVGWLGQFVGVRELVGLTPLAQRMRIRETAGFQRGTKAAIEGAAKQFLSGSRQVKVYERDGSPYRLRVRTYQTETPDAARVEAAVRAQKPAGLVLTYEVVTGASYGQMDTAHGTYADMDAAYPTYQDQTLAVIA